MEDLFNEIEDDDLEEHEYTTSYNLNSYGIDFDVSGLVRRLNAGSIYLPDFQRNYVWKPKEASRLVSEFKRSENLKIELKKILQRLFLLQ